MTVAYPSDLPTAQRATKVRRQEATFTASDVLAGYGHFEASGTDRPVQWDVTFRFSTVDAPRFMRWFVDDIDEGLLPFTMDIRVETGVHSFLCRFLPEGLLDAKEEAETWEYTARIIARPAEVIAAATVPPEPLAPIEWVTGSDSDNNEILSIPAHDANDLIIAYAKGSGAFNNPVLPSGWTDILGSGIETFNSPLRFYCIRDTAGSLTTLDLPANTADVAFMVYRNASGTGETAITAEAAGPTSASTPALGALSEGSWAVAGADINQASVLDTPDGLTERVVRPVPMGGGTGAAADTNGVVASYAGGDLFTWGTAAIKRTFAFEILNG